MNITVASSESFSLHEIFKLFYTDAGPVSLFCCHWLSCETLNMAINTVSSVAREVRKQDVSKLTV